MPTALDTATLRARVAEDAGRVAEALGFAPAATTLHAAELTTDDVAGAACRGVCRARPAEAAQLLGSAVARVEGVDVWTARDGATLLTTTDADLLGVWTFTGTAEPLLRAVLGHHALEGVPAAYAVGRGEDPLLAALGFTRV